MIWCTVLALIQWAVQHHLGLANNSFYVDDVFGSDDSGICAPLEHEGETRSVPLDQWRALSFWKWISLPFDWDKHISTVRLGCSSTRSIVVLGFTVNPISLTIELGQEKRDLLAARILEFICIQAPPLKAWSEILGHANWVLNVAPLLRPLLQSAYEKLSDPTSSTGLKEKPNASVRHKKATINDLRLAEEIVIAPPLDLRDPGVVEWDNNEADLVLHTDACLSADDTGTTGLGFARTVVGDNKIHAWQYRFTTRMSDIQFAEMLAIYAAIQHVLDLLPSRSPDRPIRRLLIRSDSALCVYAFDARRAVGPACELLIVAFDALRRARIDPRVKHISGKKNEVADLAYRRSPVAPQHVIGFDQVHSFRFAPSLEQLGVPLR